nr:hypothetical protein [Prescottella equi]
MVSPQTRRSVNATCDSADSAGWQHVKINRNWSSATDGISSSKSSNFCRNASTSRSPRSRSGA